MAAIVESAQDAVIGVDPERTVVSWNAAAEQLYGYAAADARGRPIDLVVPLERVDEVRRDLETALRGEATACRLTVRRTSTGVGLDIATAVSPVRDGSGAVIGASLIDRDASEQLWMVASLDTTLAAHEAALAEAREVAARSRRFLADAAHQLRTPIAGIQAAAENLLRGVDRRLHDRLLYDLVRETVRASRLMGSLLRTARLDEQEPLSPQPCDIVSLCAEEVDRAWSLAPDLEFGFKAGELPSEWPELDSGAVVEILGNLLDNARRHAATRIEVSLERTDAGLAVRVSDDGPGVAPGWEERIFERFVSAGEQAGSGLGLAIARELARAHGGDLTYDSGGFVLQLDVPAWGGPPADPDP